MPKHYSESASPSGWLLYKRLLAYVKPHWTVFLVAFFGFILYAVTQTGFAKWLEYVVDTVGKGEFEWRGVLALSVIGLFAVRGLGTFLASYALAYIARRVINQLRMDLFDKLLNLPRSFFDQQSSGQILSRLTYNVEQVTGAATDAVRVVLREGLTIIGLLGYLIFLNWKLTLIFLAAVPLIALVVRFAAKRLRRLSTEIQESVGDVAHVASESIKGIEVVRIFGGKDREHSRFQEANERNRQQFMKLVVTQSINTPLVQLIVACALGLLMYTAMHPDLMAEMSAGEFIVFITAAGMIAKPMRQVTEVNSIIQRGIAAAESVFEFTDSESEVDHGQQLLEATGEIELRNLSFTYSGTSEPVLHNLNLHIKPGESIALVGRSGSGKSTLVGLLPRFHDLSDGELLLDGVQVQDIKLASLRSQIALVNQQVVLFEGSIADNIAYGALAGRSREQVEAAAQAAHVLEFSDRMPDGLDTLIGENGTMLSGGQRQRIAIARALLKDAPILILDEATSALDTESERHIQAAMENVMRGRTTLVIAHRLSTIENVDRILVMDAGRIVESGSHQVLLELGGAYASLHGLQFNQTDTDAGQALGSESK